MTIDVHGHIIPESLLQNPEFGIALEGRVESGLRIRAWGVTVDAIKEDLFNPEIQVRSMGAEGIDKRVISLPPFLFGYGKESSWAKTWVQAGNDALSGICAKSSGRFVGFGIVPLQDPDLAVAEMRRCFHDLGLSGIEIGTQVKGQDLDRGNLYPLFRGSRSAEMQHFGPSEQCFFWGTAFEILSSQPGWECHGNDDLHFPVMVRRFFQALSAYPNLPFPWGRGVPLSPRASAPRQPRSSRVRESGRPFGPSSRPLC